MPNKAMMPKRKRTSAVLTVEVRRAPKKELCFFRLVFVIVVLLSIL